MGVEHAVAHQFGTNATLLDVHERRSAEKVRFVRSDRSLEIGHVWIGQGIGILPHDEVTGLESHDALGFDSERDDPMSPSRVHERFPDVQSVPGRDVDLKPKFAREADAHHSGRYLRHVSLAHGHVGERISAQIDVGDFSERVYRVGAREVHGGIVVRDVGDVDVEVPPALEVPLDVLVHAVGAAGGGRDVPPVGAQVCRDAVVADHAFVRAHHAVSHAARRQLAPPVDVQHLQQIGSAGPDHLKLSERAHVDQSDATSGGQDLLCRIAVMLGTLPQPSVHHASAVFDVPVVHRGVFDRLHLPSGQHSQADRVERRPAGGRARRGDGFVVGRGAECHRVGAFVLSLTRSHAQGAVPFQEFHAAVALGDRVVDVLDGDVLVEAHERHLAAEYVYGRGIWCELGGLERRNLFAEFRRCAVAQAEFGGGVQSVHLSLRHRRCYVVRSGHSSGRTHPFWQLCYARLGGGGVVSRLSSGLVQQAGRRRPANRHRNEITLHDLACSRCDVDRTREAR